MVEAKKELEKIYKNSNLYGTYEKIGLWQVHPIEKGTRIYSETH